MKISVIIPTFNRLKALTECLENVFAQRLEAGDAMEVLVADDGSTDGTAGALKDRYGSKDNFIYLFQANGGPAAARNAAMRRASGDICYFIGDDIMLGPGTAAAHLEAHKRHPGSSTAVLGHIGLPANESCSFFESVIVDKGPQFCFSKLKDGQALDFGYFYTSNISLKKHFLLEKGLFDEGFTKASWEDIELGYRLSKHGLEIIYSAAASVSHKHKTTLLEFSRKRRLDACFGYKFYLKHPELAGYVGMHMATLTPYKTPAAKLKAAAARLRDTLRYNSVTRLAALSLAPLFESVRASAPASFCYDIVLKSDYYGSLRECVKANA